MRSSPLILPRLRVDEIMDRPDLPPEDHRVALAGLHSINRISFTAQHFLAPILQLARGLGRRELHLLDVACGGGDVPLALAHLTQRHNLRLHLTLVDRSPIALEHASSSAMHLNIPCTTLRADALIGALPPADVVTNSLFLHHLDPPQVITALRRLAAAARYLLLISDLRRSRLHLVVAWLSCHLFSRSPIVHHDGPASVHAAFTRSELLRLATQAGLSHAIVQRTWPFRVLLTYAREDQ